MDGLGYIESIQRIALLNVLKPDYEAYIRKIQRFYSETFNTSLSEVENLPLDFILLTYFEYIYNKLEPEDLDKQLKLSLESPEERKKRELEEAKDEDEFLRAAEEEEKLKAKEKVDFSKIKKMPKQEIKLPEVNLEFDDKEVF